MVRISDPVLGARSLRLWVQAAEAWERSHPPAPEKCRGRLEKGPVPGARRDCRGEWGSLRVPARVAPWGCVCGAWTTFQMPEGQVSSGTNGSSPTRCPRRRLCPTPWQWRFTRAWRGCSPGRLGGPSAAQAGLRMGTGPGGGECALGAGRGGCLLIWKLSRLNKQQLDFAEAQAR